MAEFWYKLVFEFCKVEFLCWHGSPNWLGWIVLAIGGLIGGLVLFVIVVFAVGAVFDAVFEAIKRLVGPK